MRLPNLPDTRLTTRGGKSLEGFSGGDGVGKELFTLVITWIFNVNRAKGGMRQERGTRNKGGTRLIGVYHVPCSYPQRMVQQTHGHTSADPLRPGLPPVHVQVGLPGPLEPSRSLRSSDSLLSCHRRFVFAEDLVEIILEVRVDRPRLRLGGGSLPRVAAPSNLMRVASAPCRAPLKLRPGSRVLPKHFRSDSNRSRVTLQTTTTPKASDASVAKPPMLHALL
eukprot:11445113-Alexandrium_andersonii.AAC.1